MQRYERKLYKRKKFIYFINSNIQKSPCGTSTVWGFFLMSRFANRLTNSLFLTIVVVIHYFCRKLAIRSPNHNPLYHMLGKISLTSGEQFSSVAKFFFKDNRNRLNTERLCFGYKLRVRKLVSDSSPETINAEETNIGSFF